MKTRIDPMVKVLKLKIALCREVMYYYIIRNDITVCG